MVYHMVCLQQQSFLFTVTWIFVILCTGTGWISVDIGVNAHLELMDKFRYLGDMLSVESADAAVESRIWIGWNKFRQLVPLLTIDSEREIVQQLCACWMEVSPGP